MRAVVTALLLATCVPANAQTAQCVNYEAMVVGLADSYGERRIISGLNGDGTVVQMFANTETGTWTAVILHPDGMACMVAAGEQFDSTVAALPGNL